jgi:hypothetical protein
MPELDLRSPEFLGKHRGNWSSSELDDCLTSPVKSPAALQTFPSLRFLRVAANRAADPSMETRPGDRREGLPYPQSPSHL